MRRRSSPTGHPARVVAIGFIVVIALGTVCLWTPWTTASTSFTSPIDALFTATSAVSLTGLVVVDTGTYWNFWGQLCILVLIQIGGFGVVSLTSMAGMVLTGRISVRSRKNTMAEGRILSSGGVKKILKATLLCTIACELCVGIVIMLRMFSHYHLSFVESVWQGIFYAVSSFNNAGFALKGDSLTSYVSDYWIIIPIACSFIVGGVGFPVLAEVYQRIHIRISNYVRNTEPARFIPKHYSVTAKITLLGTFILIVSGFLVVTLGEWNGALSSMDFHTKILSAFFQGVSPRTAGFNSADYGQFQPGTLVGIDALMFIGGGSAGTAGGVRITTIAVIGAAVISELRGHSDVVIAKRKIPSQILRQALAVFLFSSLLVMTGIVLLIIAEPLFDSGRIIFEVISAFSTVGLSTGITADLSTYSQLILCVIMLCGRIGPLTIISAFALRKQKRHFSYPVERPYIG